MITNPGPSGVTALVIAVALLHGGPHLEAGPAANKLALSSPASVSPDPYDVSRGSARLAIPAIVRPSEGLESLVHRNARSASQTFFLRLLWRIQVGSATATRQHVRPIVPPFELVSSPSGSSEKWVAADATMLWDGRSDSGGCIHGRASYTAQIDFVRVTASGSSVHEKLIDTLTTSGSFDVTSPPPTLTVTSPADDSAFRESTIRISGAVAGQAPLTVEVAGSAVPVTQQGTFTQDVAIPEGASEIRVSVANCVGTTERAIRVFRDTQSPTLVLETPAPGSTTSETMPLIQIALADPSPSSGLVASTLRVEVGGQDRSSLFTVSEGRATAQLTAETALSPGGVRITASVADRASNVGTLDASYTISQPVTGAQGVLVGQILSGDVCNSQPLVGATVKLLHAGGVAVTDAEGRFRMPAPIGLAWVDIDKPGFLSVQRSAQVLEGQDSALPVVFLASEDSKVTHIVASEGGTVTDSTGTATLIVPPGALSQDVDIRLTLITDKRASKGPPLRNFIPGTAVRITPDRVRLNQFATLRVKNLMRMPVHPIFSFDWNSDTQVWERTVGAFITPGGQFFESQIDHFSGASPG